jgi:hypothetical protein
MNDDEALLARLRQIAAEVDPVPEFVTQAGYQALATRRLDEELAELLMDSDLMEAGRLRAAGDHPRMLSYATETVSLELQLEHQNERLVLRGFVSGATGDVVVEGAEESTHVAVDGEGWFRATPMAPGPLRIRLSTPQAAVVTPWFHP